MKKFIGWLLSVLIIGTAVFKIYKARQAEVSWSMIGLHSITAILVLITVLVLLRFLGSKGILIYAIREGFGSIIVKGGQNGAYVRMIAALKGYSFDPTSAEVTEDPYAEPMGFMGFGWIGPWPLYSAMIFDGQEQVKQINEAEGTVGRKLETYPSTIYFPLQTTERLVVQEMEVGDLAAKVDMEVALTFRLANGYIAKVRNRGSTKLLKAKSQEGLRETIATLTDYETVLKLKNATSDASLMVELVKTLNKGSTGDGPLAKSTGWELISIDVVSVQMSGANAEEMNKAYAKRLNALKEAEASGIQAERDAKNILLRGEADAKVKGLLVDQVKRRIEVQKGMTEGQALALAIENTNAQVLSVNSQGGGVTPMVDLRKQPEPVPELAVPPRPDRKKR